MGEVIVVVDGLIKAKVSPPEPRAGQQQTSLSSVPLLISRLERRSQDSSIGQLHVVSHRFPGGG